MGTTEGRVVDVPGVGRCNGGYCDKPAACERAKSCLYKSSAQEARERQAALKPLVESSTLSTTAGINPKDLMGIKKVPMLSVIPPASLIYEGAAMRYGAYLAPKADGSKGYGPFNWRQNKVSFAIYIDAILRHALAVWDGEDLAPDSGIPHIAHIKADCGILADAIERGNIVDDRPPTGNAAALLERFKIKT